PALSPDGGKLVYVLSESDWDANRQVPHLWMVNNDGSDARQITFGENGERNPQWSPDGRWISFIAKRGDDEDNQVYLMRADGGEAQRLTDHATSVSSVSWSPDGNTLYFLASDTLTSEQEAARKAKDDVYALDENYQQRHLWRFDVGSREETRITSGDYSVLSYHLSANGERFVAHIGPNPLFDFRKDSEVWSMNLDGEDRHQLTDNTVGEGGARISPDGGRVLFLAFANADFETYYNDRLFVVPADGSARTRVPLGDMEHEIVTAEWSADGRSVFFIANMGHQTQLWQHDLVNGRTEQLTKGKHSLGQWDYQPTIRRHVMAVNTIRNPGDVHVLEGGRLRQVTRHYDYLSEQFHLPRQEVISWKGADGVTVEGMIYYPHDYQPGTRYPLVVQTHGGPASSDKYGFSRSATRYNAVLTGHGYVVLQPNYRGSTGYGDAFLRDMVGGYFRQSHLDVMAGVDHLIALRVADPERMAKMGWSAGGHMTNKIITYTDRFKAASSGAGAVNWIGMYAQSDVRTYRTPWFGGTPWEKDAPIDVYWNNSPLKDIHKVSTPTLVLVGENDPRVPMPQSVELYRALRHVGVPTHLYVAPREPHGWQELRHRLYKINVELDWFARYVLEKEYVWEKVKD
ncbi:MAG: S9 family peptidase, partial [Saprospiraceae bacterium]|nr:S9 family peptidase [Saprospiraceae bacterium]